MVGVVSAVNIRSGYVFITLRTINGHTLEVRQWVNVEHTDFSGPEADIG